jgi:hypothetical protein
MKTKKFEKKLVLNKKTIVDLNSGMMGNVHGGEEPDHGWTVFPSCYLGPTDCPDCTAPSGCVTNCGTCATCDTCVTNCGTCGEISCVICRN